MKWIPLFISAKIGGYPIRWDLDLPLRAVANLDQHQYGSLKHILEAAEGNILYPLAQHLADVRLCEFGPGV